MALADEMIKTIMKNLDCDEETAKDVIECDKRIDKGEKLFELAETEKGNSRKARQVARMPKPQTNREKKVDNDKREIINLIAETVENLTDEGTVYINNPEREIEFVKGNRKYKIVLSCPRS